MYNFTQLARSALLVVSLAACSSSPPTLDNVAGVYGRTAFAFGGSILLLRSDGTYSVCYFSDTPQFDGQFFMETHGSYSLYEHRVRFREEAPMHWSNKYVIRVRGKVYMITEEEYLDYRDDEEVIRDNGLVPEFLSVDNPYTCGDRTE
jgi:hypothetical protein